MSAGNAVTTRQPNRIAPHAGQMLDALPPWLRYLVAAYPSANVVAGTYLVYEDQFADVDADTMMQAVKAAVKAHQYNTFPAIPEIRREVDRLRERAVLAISENFAALLWLRRRRAELTERSFTGDAFADEFAALADEFAALGCEHAAVSLRARGKRYGEVEHV